MGDSLIPYWQERQSEARKHDRSIGWEVSEYLKAMLPLPAKRTDDSATRPTCSSMELDAHLIISAIQYGWDSVRAHVERDPILVFISSILDVNLLSTTDCIDRLPGILAVFRTLKASSGVHRAHRGS